MTFPLLLQSHLNGVVQLTQERWEHIEEKRRQGERRPDIAMITHTLKEPEEIRASNYDPEVRLYYRAYGNLWSVVVVKHDPQGSFVLTAYMTDRIKQGGLLWRKS
ncbi:MAG: PBECR2 nuclease fold domain-containing protein [Candidatus Bipolaricaulota bacterium]|nr:PBECR2 nuclease fold domain-containing protein [Candidatus Bipolaricaulota bacterium]